MSSKWSVKIKQTGTRGDEDWSGGEGDLGIQKLYQ